LSEWAINPADLAVFGIILVSALFAFVRGFIKEMLSVAAWLGAVFAAIYGRPYLEPFVLEFISEPMAVTAIASASIFVATVVLLSLIGHLIAGRIRDSMLSALDRSLGFLFGVVRGGMLISLAFLVLTEVRPTEAERPKVLREAKTVPFIAMGADILRRLVPPDTFPRRKAGSAEATPGGDHGIDARRTLEALMGVTPKPSAGATESAATDTDSGYNRRQRKDLERLIQSTQ
jgi:membrane protein required for colicin V production